MKGLLQYTINIKGQLLDLGEPQVMGILNVTPDSFYSGSRKQTEEEIRSRVEQIVYEGGSMIDIGAYSSRPGAGDVSVDEEMSRLRYGMKIVREMAPYIPVSVDTFRADVAKMTVEECGADVINDISGGQLDKDMFSTVAKLRVPYVLVYKGPLPAPPGGSDASGLDKDSSLSLPLGGVWRGLLLYFAERVQLLRDLGQKDIILDPGFGFGKTIEHNYELMDHLEELKIFELPILSGVSRKSMIYKVLECTPDEALNGTTVLNTISLLKGANILRVHDVKEAVEVRKIVKKMLEEPKVHKEELVKVVNQE